MSVTNSAAHLHPGDRAPAPELYDSQGRPVRLDDAWRDGPALLVFLRHYG